MASLQKPSEKEEEYFARKELERKKKAADERAAAMAEAEKSTLRDMHYMHCPKCGHELVAVELRGTSIDTCTQCEGIWLDAGELEQVAGQDGFLSKLVRIFK